MMIAENNMQKSFFEIRKNHIDNLIKGFNVDVRSAVGIVFDKENNFLMGKAVCDDERNGKWVFLGGGVDQGESPLQASIREVYEEGGVSSHPLRLPMIIHPSKPTVAFFCLKSDEVQPKMTLNEEFSEMQWFSLSKLPEEMLSLNRDILKMIK